MTTINDAIIRKTNYTMNIDYLKNNIITEYDIHSAGLNILRDSNLLTQDQYEYFLSLDKKNRNIELGNLQRENPKLIEGLNDGFYWARKIFCEKNNISTDDILSIKKDAIFVINSDEFIDGKISEHVEFSKKSTYDSFIKLENKEHYLTQDSRELVVKKYKHEVVSRQRDYFFKLIKDLLLYDYYNDSDSIYTTLATFKYNYVTKKLPVEYYCNLADNQYHVNAIGYTFGLDTIDADALQYVSIDYNLKYILQLISLLL